MEKWRRGREEERRRSGEWEKGRSGEMEERRRSGRQKYQISNVISVAHGHLVRHRIFFSFFVFCSKKSLTGRNFLLFSNFGILINMVVRSDLFTMVTRPN